jgi:RNA methyltransferase, TrmH family
VSIEAGAIKSLNSQPALSGRRMHKLPSSAVLIQQVLTRARSLVRRETRRAEGCFWIEGPRSFVQAYEARLEFDAVVYCPLLVKSRAVEVLVRRVAASGARRVRVTPEQFRTVCTLERASGIGAIVKQRWTPLAQAEPTRGLCWLVVEEIRSPGNLGSILRTAEACAVGGVIFVGPRCDPFDPAVVRASMGGISHLALVRTTHAELSIWVRKHQVELIGLTPDADRLWTEVPDATAIGLVIGEERQGLSSELRAMCHTRVRLPMAGRADSLNVGVAAGVMMYEFVRRRQSAMG